MRRGNHEIVTRLLDISSVPEEHDRALLLTLREYGEQGYELLHLTQTEKMPDPPVVTYLASFRREVPHG